MKEESIWDILYPTYEDYLRDIAIEQELNNMEESCDYSSMDEEEEIIEDFYKYMGECYLEITKKTIRYGIRTRLL